MSNYRKQVRQKPAISGGWGERPRSLLLKEENMRSVILRMGQRVFSYSESGEEDMFTISYREKACPSYLKTMRKHGLVILEVRNVLFACEEMPRWQVR